MNSDRSSARARWRRWLQVPLALLLLALLDRQLSPHVGFGMYQEDVNRFWTLKPGSVTMFLGKEVRVNSVGFRGPEPPRRKPGDYRVMLLGDSCIFGHGLAQDETLGAQLQQRLQAEAPDRRVLVFNLGVPGYSSHQGVDLVRNVGRQLQVDAVVCAYLWGDMSPDLAPDSQRFPSAPVQDLRRVLWRSNLYRVLRSWWLDSGGPPVGPPGQNPRGPVNRVSPPETTRNLVALARESGASRVVFLALPSRSLTGTPGYPGALEAASKQVPGARYLDLADAWLRRYSFEENSEFFMDELHPNAGGCRVLAEDLAEVLQPDLSPAAAPPR